MRTQISLLFIIIVGCVYAFIPMTTKIYRRFTSSHGQQSENQMSVDELKAELELRSVDFSDCMSKQDLAERLIQSRTFGKADPDILKKFNEMSQEGITVDSSMLDEEITKDLIAKDGNLPGGMDVDMMKALASDPEILTMLKDKKMQDIMSAIMTQGPDAMKKFLSDPDAMLLIQKLGKAIERSKKT